MQRATIKLTCLNITADENYLFGKNIVFPSFKTLNTFGIKATICYNKRLKAQATSESNCVM